jgi:predicted methyltransferase
VHKKAVGSLQGTAFFDDNLLSGVWMVKPVSDDRVQRAYRLRIAVFLMAAGTAILSLFLVSQGSSALTRLEVVERDRDEWQRPDQVFHALDLRNGSVVGDVGCGSGYFAMRLSPAVGGDGRVLAEDIRRLPLLVVRIRALLGNRHNIDAIEGQPDDPRFGSRPLDAVLIANTYHEFTHPRIILEKIKGSLRSGGRLVVLDRGPSEPGDLSREAETQRHELAVSFAESEILRSGFELDGRRDRFIEPPGDKPWWLLIARKP